MCGRIYAASLSLLFVLLTGAAQTLIAQDNVEELYGTSISVNAVDLASLAVINAEAGAELSRRVSLYFNAKYSPFEFGSGDDIRRNRQIAFNAGVRLWPWHTFSGWFFGAGAGFMRFNRSNWLSERNWEGDFYGLQVGVGYSYMLAKHINLDFGAGVMAGPCRYSEYSCPTCGVLKDKGKKIHVEPNNILIQLSYLF